MEKLYEKEIGYWTRRLAHEAEKEQPATRRDSTYTLICGEWFIKELNAALDMMSKKEKQQLLNQNPMNETVLQRIIAFVFGHKYYANIIRTRGLGGTADLTSFIHSSKADAEAHKRDILLTASFEYVETISFRSRIQYVKTFHPDGSRSGQQIK
ncbi:MAG: hypothetical protein II841_08820 [Bacteroidales bacterium]|nr:hypothetical protein [Bacteroidales bacterium]